MIFINRVKGFVSGPRIIRHQLTFRSIPLCEVTPETDNVLNINFPQLTNLFCCKALERHSRLPPTGCHIIHNRSNFLVT